MVELINNYRGLKSLFELISRYQVLHIWEFESWEFGKSMWEKRNETWKFENFDLGIVVASYLWWGVGNLDIDGCRWNISG